jgi:hypothetical protein
MHLGEQQESQHEGIASAHDRVSFKQPIEPADIEVDARPRSLFLDRCRLDGAEWHTPRYARSAALGADAEASFRGTCGPSTIDKHIGLSDNRLTVRYRIDTPAEGEFETELNLAMPSCDGFMGRYVFEGRIPGGFGQPLELPDITTLTLEDQILGGTVEVLCSEPVRVSARPHHTVSQSEEGFEKVMQAVTLALRCRLSSGLNTFAIALEVRRA